MIDKSILKELKEAREKLNGIDWKRGSGHPMNEGIVYRNPDNIKGEMNGFVTYDPAVAEFIVLAKNHMLSLLNSYEELEKERDAALDNADFWERELNNFRRNAAHRAEQLAEEKVKAAESSRDQMKQTVRTLADALRVIAIAKQEPSGGEYWSARKLADEWGIYNEDLEGDRVLLRLAESALSDPIVKQILEEKSS